MRDKASSAEFSARKSKIKATAHSRYEVNGCFLCYNGFFEICAKGRGYAGGVFVPLSTEIIG